MVWSKLYVDCQEGSHGSPSRSHWWVEIIYGVNADPLRDDCGGFLRSPHNDSIISIKGIFPGEVAGLTNPV